jgi:hypothetical protein
MSAGLDRQPSNPNHPQVLTGNAQDMKMVKDNSVDIGIGIHKRTAPIE